MLAVAAVGGVYDFSSGFLEYIVGDRVDDREYSVMNEYIVVIAISSTYPRDVHVPQVDWVNEYGAKGQQRTCSIVSIIRA